MKRICVLPAHKKLQCSEGETPLSVQRLLPRLRDDQQTEVVIVALPEATPVFEAMRLRDDLKRAGINNKWWIVNQCLSMTDTKNPMLIAHPNRLRCLNLGLSHLDLAQPKQ